MASVKRATPGNLRAPFISIVRGIGDMRVVRQPAALKTIAAGQSVRSGANPRYKRSP